MLDIFDLIIYARGRQASFLLAEAVNKGLKVALIYENDKQASQCFTPIETISEFNISSIFSSAADSKFIKYLKKSAANQLIPTEIKLYRKFSLSDSIRIKLYQFLWPDKIQLVKNQEQEFIQYQAYKYSSNRLSVSLLKYAQKNSARIFQYSSLISTNYTKKELYKLNLYDNLKKKDFTLKSKSILINPVVNKKDNTSNNDINQIQNCIYFRYPLDKLSTIKNSVYELDGLTISIISWFDMVYISFQGKETLSLEQAFGYLKHLSGFNETDIKLVNSLGTRPQIYTKSLLGFHLQNKQISFPIRKSVPCYKYSNQIMNKIVSYLGIGHQGSSILHKVILPGSDLGISYHPLRIMEIADERYDQAKQIIKSPLKFKKLFYTYGTEIELITEKAFDYFNQSRNEEEAWIKATIWYSIKYEMCKTPESFIETWTDRWMDMQKIDMEALKKIFHELIRQIKDETSILKNSSTDLC